MKYDLIEGKLKTSSKVELIIIFPPTFCKYPGWMQANNLGPNKEMNFHKNFWMFYQQSNIATSNKSVCLSIGVFPRIFESHAKTWEIFLP